MSSLARSVRPSATVMLAGLTLLVLLGSMDTSTLFELPVAPDSEALQDVRRLFWFDHVRHFGVDYENPWLVAAYLLCQCDVLIRLQVGTGVAAERGLLLKGADVLETTRKVF